VDRTLGLEDVDLQRITPLPPHFAGVEQSWFTGLFLFRDTVALLINPGWLLSQAMDVFVAKTLAEGAALEEQHVLAPPPEAPAETPKPAPARKRRSRKPVEASGGDAVALNELEDLVLEESTDVEDSQTPWADT
jgi:hypothetical protein